MILPFAIGVGLLIASVAVDDVNIGGRRLSFVEKIVASFVGTNWKKKLSNLC